ncbi:MAG: hypothetical protein PHI31_09615 [Desulfuromonadaceae bacterium]|nr:hypothetical protein [Desulfuromonadaceae bacterium]
MTKPLADVEQIEKFLIDHYLLIAFASTDADAIRLNMDKAQVLNGPFTLYKIANHYCETRRFDAAIDLYVKAYDQGLRDALFLREAADCILRHGSFEQYSHFYRTMLENDPTCQFARFILGMIDNYNDVVLQLSSVIKVSHGSEKPQIIFHTTFWGARFVDIFLNYTVPILLAKKNIPDTAAQYEIHYVIATTQADYENMQRREMFSNLQKHVQVHFVCLPDNLLDYANEYVKKNKSGKMIPISLLTNSMHYAAVECSRLLSLDLVMLYPDHILSDSFLTDLLSEKQQYGALSGVCFRLCYDKSLLEEVNSHRTADGVLAIDSQALVSLLVEYLPDVNYVNSSICFTSFPVYVCWKIANQGLIAHVNHYCVWLMRGGALKVPVFPSLDPIDGFFLDKLFADKRNIGLASEKIIGFDLGDNPLIGKADGTDFDVAKVATWLKSSLTDVHQKYFEKCMKYSVTGSYDSPEWDKTIAMARSAINRIIMLAKHP